MTETLNRPDTTADTSTTYAVDLQGLRRILGNALVCAGTDDTLPVLTGVRLEAEGSQLVAVATDRYVLGTDRLKVEGLEPFEPILLAGKPLAAALKVLSKRARFGTLTIGAAGVTLSDHETTVTVPMLEGSFPRWRSLLPDTLDENRDGVTVVGFSPAIIGKLSKIDGGERNLPIRLEYQTPTRPAVVTIGATFRGLVMPVRLSS